MESASEWDRTHVLTALGTYDFDRGWRASARFSFSTGRPYSRSANGVLVGPYNQDRLPPVHRVDLRVEKKWMLDREPSAPLQTSPVPEFLVRGRPIDACSYVRSPAFAIPGVGVEGRF